MEEYRTIDKTGYEVSNLGNVRRVSRLDLDMDKYGQIQASTRGHAGLLFLATSVQSRFIL